MSVSARLLVNVQQHGRVVTRLIGRAAAMVMWVVVYSDRINETFRGSITFDWEGPSLRPQFTQRSDRISTDTPLPASDTSSS